MRWTPNITTSQRWFRGIGGVLMLAVGLAVYRLPLSVRAVMAALGVIGILQALSGF